MLACSLNFPRSFHGLLMRIISWNINSLRLRLPTLARLALESNADIICLQETKVHDRDFPLAALFAMGYMHVAYTGEKSYNGVAILSRFPLTEVKSLRMAERECCRHISALVADKFWLHNFYVPAGGDIADPRVNDKFAYKLDYVDGMTKWFGENCTESSKIVLVGDLNIAPGEHDVWSHKQLLKVVSHTEIEVAKMRALQKSLNWCDVARHICGDDEKLYSWWSYRNRDWRKSNRGRRLDHIWLTPCIIERIKGFQIMKDVRDWTLPSDHVPVVIDLDY